VCERENQLVAAHGAFLVRCWHRAQLVSVIFSLTWATEYSSVSVTILDVDSHIL